MCKYQAQTLKVSICLNWSLSRLGRFCNLYSKNNSETMFSCSGKCRAVLFRKLSNGIPVGCRYIMDCLLFDIFSTMRMHIITANQSFTHPCLLNMPQCGNVDVGTLAEKSALHEWFSLMTSGYRVFFCN